MKLLKLREKVSSVALERSGKMNFNDIKNPNELLQYMEQNITYGFVDKYGQKYKETDSWDTWYSDCVVQDATGILESGFGTCWDQVELERDWFKKHNYNFKTIFIQFEVGMERTMPTHTFLIYEVNNKWYWFEHSFAKNKGIHKFNSIEEAIQYVKDKQLEYAIETGVATDDDKNYIVDYEYSKPDRNLSVREYLQHVTSNRNKKL